MPGEPVVRPNVFEIEIHHGDCPAVEGVGDCVVNCEHDGECAANEKCCSNGCGSGCMEAIRGKCFTISYFINSDLGISINIASELAT